MKMWCSNGLATVMGSAGKVGTLAAFGRQCQADGSDLVPEVGANQLTGSCNHFQTALQPDVSL